MALADLVRLEDDAFAGDRRTLDRWIIETCGLEVPFCDEEWLQRTRKEDPCGGAEVEANVASPAQEDEVVRVVDISFFHQAVSDVQVELWSFSTGEARVDGRMYQ